MYSKKNSLKIDDLDLRVQALENKPIDEQEYQEIKAGFWYNLGENIDEDSHWLFSKFGNNISFRFLLISYMLFAVIFGLLFDDVFIKVAQPHFSFHGILLESARFWIGFLVLGIPGSYFIWTFIKRKFNFQDIKDLCSFLIMSICCYFIMLRAIALSAFVIIGSDALMKHHSFSYINRVIFILILSSLFVEVAARMCTQFLQSYLRSTSKYWRDHVLSRSYSLMLGVLGIGMHTTIADFLIEKDYYKVGEMLVRFAVVICNYPIFLVTFAASHHDAIKNYIAKNYKSISDGE